MGGSSKDLYYNRDSALKTSMRKSVSSCKWHQAKKRKLHKGEVVPTRLTLPVTVILDPII